MLDKPLIGEELKNLKLKCELCGQTFDADNEDEINDCELIDEFGKCSECCEQYGYEN